VVLLRLVIKRTFAGMDITVCIVDDTNDIRVTLEEIIKMADGYRLLGSFSNAEEALVKLPALHPDVVLMDINLVGGMSGIECVSKLKPRHPEILFMMCTVYEEDDKIFEALTAGANAYILKKTPPGKLLDAIRDLKAGGAPMSSQIARKVVAFFQHKPAMPPTGHINQKLDILSNREKEILELLSKGMLYKEIAQQLFISHETVRKHVYHIYDKLHVNNRVEAVNKYFGR
jgi:DNA-binding NarL/FixJ family response regulator